MRRLVSHCVTRGRREFQTPGCLKVALNVHVVFMPRIFCLITVICFWCWLGYILFSQLFLNAGIFANFALSEILNLVSLVCVVWSGCVAPGWIWVPINSCPQNGSNRKINHIAPNTNKFPMKICLRSFVFFILNRNLATIVEKVGPIIKLAINITK